MLTLQTVKDASEALNGLSAKDPKYAAIMAVLGDLKEDVEDQLEDTDIVGEPATFLRGSQSGLRVLRRTLEDLRTGQIMPWEDKHPTRP